VGVGRLEAAPLQSEVESACLTVDASVALTASVEIDGMVKSCG
jgi:hypothetical protein